MSYAEAARDRKRKRKNEKLGLILGLLQGVGGQLMAQRQRQKEIDFLSQRDTLRYQREMAQQQAQQQALDRRAALGAMTDLEVARMRGGQERSISAAEAEAAGMADEDLFTEIQAAKAGLKRAETDFMVDPDSYISELRAQRRRRGYERLRSPAGQGANTGAIGGSRATPEPVQTGSPDAKSTQQAVGQRTYQQKLMPLYTRALQGDQAAWAELSTIFPSLGAFMQGPQIQQPQFMQPAGAR